MGPGCRLGMEARPIGRLTSPCTLPRDVLPAAGGGGHHGGGGGGRGLLLLRAGPPAPPAVLQRGLQPALAGLGSGRHQVRAGGLQHQRQQRRLHAAGVRPAQDPHHLLREGITPPRPSLGTLRAPSSGPSDLPLTPSPNPHGRASSTTSAVPPSWRSGWPTSLCWKPSGLARPPATWTAIPPSTSTSTRTTTTALPESR